MFRQQERSYMEDIVLIGFGGHGKSVADAIEAGNKYRICGYTDLQDNHNEYRYLGTDDVLKELCTHGITRAFLCVGYLGKGRLREKLDSRLRALGFSFPIIIDPTAIISKKAKIGDGTFVGKRAVINAEAIIGKQCIINTGAIVEHECKIDDFAHVAVEAVLCGQVIVGKAALIGANATVIQCREVKEREIIPAGAVVR